MPTSTVNSRVASVTRGPGRAAHNIYKSFSSIHRFCQSPLRSRPVMTCFRIGNQDSLKSGFLGGQLQQQQQQQKRPFVEFSADSDRANLMSLGGGGTTTLGLTSSSTRRQRRRRSQSRTTAGGKRRRVTRRVRIVKGNVALRVSGLPGIQRVKASRIVRFLPITKLQVAAKRALGTAGGGLRRRTRRKGRLGRRRVRKGRGLRSRGLRRRRPQGSSLRVKRRRIRRRRL